MSSVRPIELDHVRLRPGRHESPREGACVVELASLLAGEEFSDRPECVCPVIGAFLRAWNDRAAYADRLRLRPYAERVIGSRASAAVTRQRRDLCLEWSGVDRQTRRVRRRAALVAARLRIAGLVGIREALNLNEGAPEYAARLLLGRRDVDEVFIILDAMLAIGYSAGDGGSILPPEEDARAGGAPNGNGAAPSANGNGHAPVANGNGQAPALNGDGNGNGRPVPANGSGTGEKRLPAAGV